MSSSSTINTITRDLRIPPLSQPPPQGDPQGRLLRNQRHPFCLQEPPGTHRSILSVPEHPPRFHFRTLGPQHLPLRLWQNAV